jgi:hypothetical protein
LILKGPSKRRADDDSDDEPTGDALDEEEKAALRMLNAEQRKMFVELEQAGANPSYLKKKLKSMLVQQQNVKETYVSNEARAF